MPKQLIQTAETLIPLPEGVTVSDWALERVRWQNPRLRAFLLCIRLLEGILDSNYAILHCSPQRLHEIWRRLLEISDIIRFELAPALAQPSKIPSLERARNRAEQALLIISRTTLEDLERLPALLEDEKLLELRKLICVSIGKLHGFVQDTFCEIIAADPRSLHDADYFMSKRFPRDIEEAEWLLASVSKLGAFLQDAYQGQVGSLEVLQRMLRAERAITDGPRWIEARATLETFEGELTELLKETLSLRGIRFDELEILDRYTYEIPSRCQLIFEYDRAAHELSARLTREARGNGRPVAAAVGELTASHSLFAERIGELITELLSTIHDLAAFVPLWIKNLHMRRALFLQGLDGSSRHGHQGTAAGSG